LAGDQAGAIMIKNVLSIAGSDPSGGAGIQADLKTFSAQGVYGMAVITALTAQNTRGVIAIHLPPAGIVADQIAAIFADIRVDAVKIGMIANAEIAEAVADVLLEQTVPWIVLDPVMVAKGGARLLEPDAVSLLKERLCPLSQLITPNIAEAAALLDEPPIRSRHEMAALAERLAALGARAVYLKGGHLDENDSPDLLVAAGKASWIEGRRYATANTHGTGCTLSAALAARLALGDPLETAARQAKAYVAAAIAASDALSVGHGHGPTHHFHALWQRD
jgi:hydroxymethylpyrimidine/phosphomethylpyrimidine kinase